MELARIANGDQYPTSLPSDVSPSQGNVLQLTAVSDSTTQFCINGYGPGNKVLSVQNGSSVISYPCPGATIGTPVGGSVPLAPRGVNLVADFSRWSTSGDITYNSGTGEMVCGNTSSGTAKSPLMRVDGQTTGTFSYQAMATLASPTRPTSGSYVGSQYRGADGTTGAYNTAPSPGPYTGNGSAPTLSALDSWQSFNFGMTMGPAIIYAYLTVNCQTASPSYTSDTHYKNPTFTVN